MLDGAVLAMVANAALYLVPLPAPPSPRPLPESTKLLDREGRTLYESAGPADAHYTYVALEEIRQRLKQAVMATEDASFYSHPGVDVAATLRAAFTNVRHGELRSGGSTITQQLAPCGSCGKLCWPCGWTARSPRKRSWSGT